jgi:hypothetical protein
MERMSGKSGRKITVQAKLRPGPQRSISAGFDERLQMSGNLERRELIKPVFVPSSLELPFLDCVVQDKTSDSIDQRGNNAHMGNNGCTLERPDRRFAQNSAVFFKRTVGSFGCRSQSVQLPISFGCSGDFENKTRMLRDGNMRGISESIGAMKTVPVNIETGRKLGFDAFLETGERKRLGSRDSKPFGRVGRPIIASFKESFTDQLFVPGVAID